MKYLAALLFVSPLAYSQTGAPFTPADAVEALAANLICQEQNNGSLRLEFRPTGTVKTLTDEDGEVDYTNQFELSITGAVKGNGTFTMNLTFHSWWGYFRSYTRLADFTYGFGTNSESERADLSVLDSKMGIETRNGEAFSSNVECRFYR